MATAVPPKAHEMRQTLSEIQQNLQCPICLEVLSDPHNTLCGHSYCKECICTAISSSKKPKCPLCKEHITKRSLRKNEMLSQLVDAVGELEKAIISDTGITNTPPKVVPHNSGVSGTPGVRLHSVLHPTPLKPRPLDDEQSCGESSDGDEREGGEGKGEDEMKNRPSTSASVVLGRKKRKLSQSVMDLGNEASSSSNASSSPSLLSSSSCLPHSSKIASQPAKISGPLHQIANNGGREEDLTQDPANAALIEALNGASLRLSDSYTDSDVSRPNLRQKRKASQTSKDSESLHNELIPPSHATPNRIREIKRLCRERRVVGKAAPLRNGGAVQPSVWLVTSDDSDEDYVPNLKVATPILPDIHPFLSVSTTPNLQRCPEGRAESSRGTENQPSQFSAQTNGSCSLLNKKASSTTAERKGDKARHRQKKPRVLKQAPLEIFCK